MAECKLKVEAEYEAITKLIQALPKDTSLSQVNELELVSCHILIDG